MSVGADLVLSSRKASSGYYAVTSFLSALLDVLPLNAHRDSAGGEVRNDTLLALGIGADDRAVALRHLLQANLEDTLFAKDMALYNGEGVWDGVMQFNFL